MWFSSPSPSRVPVLIALLACLCAVSTTATHTKHDVVDPHPPPHPHPHPHPDPAPAPARPYLAQYTQVELAELVCTGVGPGCAGPVSGIMHGWWEFDQNGWFSRYREDAVLGSTFFVSNREYATPVSSFEYYLLNQTSTTFGCTTLPVGMSFHRTFENATLVGPTTWNGIPAYHWQDTWVIQGVPSKVALYVSNPQGRLVGWSLADVGGVSYVYHRWVEMPKFSDDLFQRPDVPCQAAVADQI